MFSRTGSEADGHVSHPEHPTDCPAASTALAVTHTFHIPVNVSRRLARQLIHAFYKDGSPLCVGLTPTDPFPSGSYLAAVSMCTFISSW